MHRAARRWAAAPLALALALVFVFTASVLVWGTTSAQGRDLPVPVHTADEARHAADEVLSQAEYQRPEPSIIQRLRNWIIDQVERLLGEVLGEGSPALVAWIILALAVGLLVFFVVRFAGGVTADATHHTDVVTRRLRSAEDWRAEASAHEESGEWRAALRCRYRALVADLAQRGLVDEVPGRTTGEYRAEVSENVPKAAPEFSGATELFEAAWYGNLPTGEQESARFRELADKVLLGARR